ncbi:unnamed protein product [Amoebophrya sp. A120]|nr:unnamed protein product [Amoebophrya sp. A120]|eukprot:GSA120T00017725001.1
MPQGFKIKASKNAAFTARKAHVNVKKNKKRNTIEKIATRGINKGIEHIISQAAVAPGAGPGMSVVKIDAKFQATSIKGKKQKSLSVGVGQNRAGKK